MPKKKKIELVTTGYQCFHCLTNGVIWQADFSFEDYCMDGDGIVHVCKCANCGADITYYCSNDPEEKEYENGRRKRKVGHSKRSSCIY